MQDEVGGRSLLGEITRGGARRMLVVLQEAITLVVFVVFAALWLGEGLTLRCAAAFALVLGAVAVAFL